MGGSTEWRTPPAFFKKLWQEFSFTVDAAATDDNALVRPHSDPRCPHDSLEAGRWCDWCDVAIGRYYTAETDGLNPEHYMPGDRVWCNPPYNDAGRWVKLAAETAKLGVLWVALLRPIIDTRAFHAYVWDHELHRERDRVQLRILPGRLAFLGPEGKVSPPSGNIVVVFRPPLEGKPC